MMILLSTCVKYDKICEKLKMSNISSNILKAKLSPYSLYRKVSEWIQNFPRGYSSYWISVKASFRKKNLI
jgi:hypothetical protein